MIRALSLSLILVSSLSAKLPELDSVFYGTVRHNINDELIAGTETIVVEAELNGIVIASSILPPGSAAYVLKIPIDDGADPRAGTRYQRVAGR